MENFNSNVESIDDEKLKAQVEATVREWIKESAKLPEPSSTRLLAEVLADPAGLDFTVGFVDRVVRPDDSKAAASQLRSLAKNPPGFLPPALKPVLKSGATLSNLAPSTVVQVARGAMRQMVSHLILDARDRQLTKSIAEYRDKGTRLNINLLGEAVLGNREAMRRLDGVKGLIQREDVDYCSIKVSSIIDHLDLWAAEETVEKIIEKLTPLYELAASQANPTFINLDMEEFHDLELTVEVFERLLSQENLKQLYAGIVLQAYLPDAERMMDRLQSFAAQRVANGGAPIKVRLVKGANLPMERVDAAIHGWPLATWGSKLESDAHYKRILINSLDPEKLVNVRLGVAGHNLFDAALAWNLMQAAGIEAAKLEDPRPLVEFEMLAGMAVSQQQAMSADLGPIRLYVPIVKPQEFDVAVSYLVRRLEENASQENFMSALLELEKREDLFLREFDRFKLALDLALSSTAPSSHRVQNRNAESHENLKLGSAQIPATPGSFINTPDTDMSIKANQAWAKDIRARIKDSQLGVELIEQAYIDSPEQVQEIINQTRAAQAQWGEKSAAERAEILRQCALVLADHRAELLEVAAVETGKILEQGDPEVSEAIDFALFYAQSIEDLAANDQIKLQPHTLTLVTPPWNFPIAITCGSILAALATGSAVIVKPAPQAKRSGAYLVSLLHKAGIPAEVLRVVDVEENEIGKSLISDPRIDQIILTGAFETAKLFQNFNPTAAIKAETSGKNAIIVTPQADLDLAVKDIVKSAFGHAGQKCSAASLVITVGSVSKSKRFMNQLIDAVESLHVGYPTDPGAVMGPIIEEPGKKLSSGLTELGAGESWLIEPKQLDDSKLLYSPGVRVGVKPLSDFHLTEYFGPVMGLIHAETLQEAIQIQNGTDYGLTAGLHSLEPNEIEYWLENVQAGNLYINRGITGAIVQRQAFGGWKKSAIGKTAKAGGPNYLVHLMKVSDSDSVAEYGSADWATAAIRSDLQEWGSFFKAKDSQQIHGEINALRYVPAEVLIRLSADLEPSVKAQLLRTVHAAQTANSRLEVSVPQGFDVAALSALLSPAKVVSESASDLTERLKTIFVERIRTIGEVEAELSDYLSNHPQIALFGSPVVMSGRIEILNYVKEQSVSMTNHRYGNKLTYEISSLK